MMPAQRRLLLARDIVWVTLGTLISALAIVLFLTPSKIAPGGVAGIGIILNIVFAVPIGLFYILANIPIQVLAYRNLGGSRVVLLTLLSVVVFSVSVEVFEDLFKNTLLSDDDLLNALFGAVVGGIGGGLILRGGGTAGGTATLGRVIQNRFGIPLSSAYLYTDTGIIALAAAFFGWESGMLALVALFLGGMVNDYVLEGPSIIRTITVITTKPEPVAAVLLSDLKRGVTAWQGEGMYTHEERTILFVTVNRAQVNQTRQLIHEVDPHAFIVVGQGHTAYGRGFKEVKTRALSAEIQESAK